MKMAIYLSCQKRNKERIEAEEEDEKVRKEKLRSMPLYKYVGETARSAFERGIEQHNDYVGLKVESHMLKHYLDKHEEEDIEKIKFGMKVKKLQELHSKGKLLKVLKSKIKRRTITF